MMNNTIKNKINLLIKVYLKYIKPSGATANEISKFINNDEFGLNHVQLNSRMITEIIKDNRHTTDLLYKKISKSKKWKTGCSYVYKYEDKVL